MPSAGAIRKLADSPILSADTIRKYSPFFNPRIFTKGAKESENPMPSGSRALPLMGEMEGALREGFPFSFAFIFSFSYFVIS